MTIPAINFPGSADDNSTLFEVINNLVTTLGANIDDVVTSIDLSDASLFPSTGGFFSIGTEVIHYESKTGNTMNVCTRGADDTTAVSHNIGDAVSMRVIAIHHNRLKDAIIALEDWAIALGGGSGSGMIKEWNQTTHGFAVNDVIKWNGSSFEKAQADSYANADALGMVIEVIDVDNFKLQSGGFVENVTGFSSGSLYFLSEATPGLLTVTEPSTVGEISKPLFIALSATTGYFFNFRGLLVPASSLEFIIDNTPDVIEDGLVAGDLIVPFDCVIEEVTMLADQIGCIVIDIWKDTFANFPPTVGDSIVATAYAQICTAIKSSDSTLTGWTKTLSAGDVLRFNVAGATAVKRVVISLKVRKFL